MEPTTINRKEVIDRFDELMQPHSPHRVLRLLGSPKMGKSHLLTKVFPVRARQRYRAHCAVVDLRNQASVPNILHLTCGQLKAASLFSTYYAAYQRWLNRPKVQVSGLRAIFSTVNIRTQSSDEEGHTLNLHLTSQFVTDAGAVVSQPLLLLFDALDSAEESVQLWLMNILLVQLASLPQVRVVVAGRTVPDPSGSYAPQCVSHKLTPVTDEAEYINYCREIGAQLPEETIPHFAQATQYQPGFFAELIFNHMGRGGDYV